MKSDYHQISAFVAARDNKAAYSVYDNGELQITRSVEIPNVSEHRALLMAVWSAVSYCKGHLPAHDLSVYAADNRVPNELTSVWYAENKASDYEDADRIESILKDCCFVCSVAFGVCKPDEGGVMADYARRMRELIETISK